MTTSDTIDTIDTTVKHYFEQSLYDYRCDVAKARYATTYESGSRPDSVGAIAEFFCGHIIEGFELWRVLRDAGYSPLDPMSPLPSAQVYGPFHVTLYLIKPDAMQAADLETIYAEVRQVYEAEVEAVLEIEVQRQFDEINAAAASKALTDKLQAQTAIAEQAIQDAMDSRAAVKANIKLDALNIGQGE